MVDPRIRKKLTSKKSVQKKVTKKKVTKKKVTKRTIRTDPKIMSILYGRTGDGGVAKHIRDEVDEILSNYLGEMSNNEIQEHLQEIDDYGVDFPEFEMNWYELIYNYLEDRE